MASRRTPADHARSSRATARKDRYGRARCACGQTYDEFRLGMSFREVRQMMWNQEDPNRPGWFRQKRRRSILGYARELKLHAWDLAHRYCEAEAEEAA